MQRATRAARRPRPRRGAFGTLIESSWRVVLSGANGQNHRRGSDEALDAQHLIDNRARLVALRTIAATAAVERVGAAVAGEQAIISRVAGETVAASATIQRVVADATAE